MESTPKRKAITSRQVTNTIKADIPSKLAEHLLRSLGYVGKRLREEMEAIEPYGDMLEAACTRIDSPIVMRYVRTPEISRSLSVARLIHNIRSLSSFKLLQDMYDSFGSNVNVGVVFTVPDLRTPTSCLVMHTKVSFVYDILNYPESNEKCFISVVPYSKESSNLVVVVQEFEDVAEHIKRTQVC